MEQEPEPYHTPLSPTFPMPGAWPIEDITPQDISHSSTPELIVPDLPTTHQVSTSKYATALKIIETAVKLLAVAEHQIEAQSELLDALIDTNNTTVSLANRFKDGMEEALKGLEKLSGQKKELMEVNERLKERIRLLEREAEEREGVIEEMVEAIECEAERLRWELEDGMEGMRLGGDEEEGEEAKEEVEAEVEAEVGLPDLIEARGTPDVHEVFEQVLPGMLETQH